MRTRILAFGLLLCLIGCSTQQPPNWDNSSTTRILRLKLWAGSSPVIYDSRYYIPDIQTWVDGRIIWVSMNNTQRRVLEGHLTPDQIKSLLQRIGDNGFFRWNNRYSKPLGGSSIEYEHFSVTTTNGTHEVVAVAGGPF